MKYIAIAIHTIVNDKTAEHVVALPKLSSTFLVLLGISHAGYIGGKIPSQNGDAPVAPPPAPA